MSAAQDHIDAVFGQFAGLKIAGGCDDCDAYQVAEQIDYGCWTINVYHDDGCPMLARKTRRRA
jgi:hypothetical protein